jgi:tRNA1(Val) A37 N6-methylase TrmN6
MLKIVAIPLEVPKSRLSPIFLESETFLSSVTGKTVLEIGVGDGAITAKVLDQKPLFLLGTEIDSAFSEMARRNLSQKYASNTTAPCYEIFTTDQIDIPEKHRTSGLKMDVAFWNPPQQPQPDGDYAGRDGQKWILLFIKAFESIVAQNGCMFVSITDMVDIQKILTSVENIGLKTTIVENKQIPLLEELNQENSPVKNYIDSLRAERHEKPMKDTMKVLLVKIERHGSCA